MSTGAGIYPSHIGFDGFASQTDWNYTRSWMADYSPYYQTGIKATYAFDDAWSAQIQVLNGWPQTLVEGTLTVEFRPWQILLIKLEGRYDHSIAHVFGASPKLPDVLPSKVQDQVLVVLGAVAAF